MAVTGRAEEKPGELQAESESAVIGMHCKDMTEVEKEKLIDYLFKQVETLQSTLAGIREELRMQREQSAEQHRSQTSQIKRMEGRAVAAEKRASELDRRIAELTAALTAVMESSVIKCSQKSCVVAPTTPACFP